jgi:hypothetical protein
LASCLGCDAKDLQLDHDPPLGARERKGDDYKPAANDPDYLIYRPKVEHAVKTRIRGEHGQYSDLVLIKRERRRLKKKIKAKRSWPKRKMQSRGFQSKKEGR